ncbi:putative tetraspanin 18, isoform 1 [Schistosoma mansoni]|uniref:putative tetraspanin 18, isoform 1 n=1 Tax=Schistosoma mansoni TaxID=6183 RepID=UPI0001A643D1|nr:putative tetraspanin 18, isoform 1 [Schistosoma mansoni]|eukprot:XP_018649476.1 putative tetraspanin 18, isoform 1 [Schistosoma mansoni]
MSLTFTIPKFFLFCLNFLLVIIGLALIAVGSWVTADDQGFIDTIQLFSSYNSIELQLYQGTSLLRYFSYAVIIMGGLLVVIAFVGCWGVVIENRGLLIANWLASAPEIMTVSELLGRIKRFASLESFTSTDDYEKSMTVRFESNYRGTFGAFSISEFDDYSLKMDKLMIESHSCPFTNLNALVEPLTLSGQLDKSFIELLNIIQPG